MKTIFLGTIMLLPCLLIFNESEHVVVNLLGLAYISFLVYAVKRSERVKQFFIDFDTMIEYYNDKIFR